MDTGHESHLTPRQSADVIEWKHAQVNTNLETGKRYSYDITSMGLTALHLSMYKPEHYLPFMEGPALTVLEMSQGMKLLASEAPGSALRAMTRLQRWGEKTQQELNARGESDSKSRAYKD